MPKGLRRFHASGQRHFITCSCYHRQPFLGSARRRDLFLTVLEQVRQQYDFVVWGYVVDA
jgi:REP-associated tyrosine transposase